MSAVAAPAGGSRREGLAAFTRRVCLSAIDKNCNNKKGNKSGGAKEDGDGCRLLPLGRGAEDATELADLPPLDEGKVWYTYPSGLLAQMTMA